MGSLHAIKEAIVQIKEIMENEYALVFKRKLDDVYRNTPPGSISGRTERSESEKKTIFLVCSFVTFCSHKSNFLVTGYTK